MSSLPEKAMTCETVQEKMFSFIGNKCELKLVHM